MHIRQARPSDAGELLRLNELFNGPDLSGADGIAASALPLLTAAQAADVSWAGVFVRVGATVAALGALLGLLSGVGRTVLAMARRGDLPRLLAAVDPGSKVPAVAQLWVAGAVAALVLLTDGKNEDPYSRSLADLLAQLRQMMKQMEEKQGK